MKSLLLILLTISFQMRCQQFPDDKVCPDCQIPCMCSEFFKPLLNEQQIAKIKMNWSDYFGSELETPFPIKKGVKTACIKLDGLGCIYPEYANQSIDRSFLDNETSYKKFHSESFYNVMKKCEVSCTPMASSFVAKVNLSYSSSTTYSTDIENFIAAWNAKFLQSKVDELNDKVKTAKKIVLFIHGYNVPYALAQLQGNILSEQILKYDTSIKPEELLLIRVFWPSGNFKQQDFFQEGCNYNNFENKRTASAYTYGSNRAYLGALTIRRLLNALETSLPITIITHSHGATLATSALINTTSKLQSGDLSKLIEKLFKAEALPKKKINVFLNAPSIPGKNTFCDIKEGAPQNNYYFFVGYNENDIVLLKRKLVIGKWHLKRLTFSKYLSSTTLGCNRRKEIKKTKKVFKQKNMPDNFEADINSTQEQHDFFCYVRQPEYVKNFKKFLEKK
jgi:hypothetical protein